MDILSQNFNPSGRHLLYNGDCLDLLKSFQDKTVQLIITSPPYNINKKYEEKRTLEDYLKWQKIIITECHRVLKDEGSICWQVGNYVNKGSIIPLDILFYPIFNDLGMKLKNRIIWHFGHGLHCSKRLSGRYETILWFTKSDNYTFNLDPIRVPQKYPNKKYFKGPNKGKLSCNPLGKNPGDVWMITNIKNNHKEKTSHPCQFPIDLVKKCILSLTNKDDIVLDPFMGSGTTSIAAIESNRKSAGAETNMEYYDDSLQRAKKSLKINVDISDIHDIILS